MTVPAAGDLEAYCCRCRLDRLPWADVCVATRVEGVVFTRARPPHQIAGGLPHGCGSCLRTPRCRPWRYVRCSNIVFAFGIVVACRAKSSSEHASARASMHLDPVLLVHSSARVHTCPTRLRSRYTLCCHRHLRSIQEPGVKSAVPKSLTGFPLDCSPMYFMRVLHACVCVCCGLRPCQSALPCCHSFVFFVCFFPCAGGSSVQAGYAQGSVKKPSYSQVCSGKTGHTEAVQVRLMDVRFAFLF